MNSSNHKPNQSRLPQLVKMLSAPSRTVRTVRTSPAPFDADVQKFHFTWKKVGTKVVCEIYACILPIVVEHTEMSVSA